MNYRFYADFTGADPRRKLDANKPSRQPPPSCQTDGATPAWDAEPEPLRTAA